MLDILDNAGDVGQVLNFLGDGAGLNQILGKVDDTAAFARVIEQFGDATQLANVLRAGRFRSISQLDELMQLTSIREIDTLTRLLDNTGSVDELLALARNLEQQTLEQASSAMSLSNKTRGPVQTGVTDTLFPGPGPFFGRNTPNVADDLYPLMQDRLNAYGPIREQLMNTLDPNSAEYLGLLRAGMPGSHSEINALNQALWNRHNMLGMADDAVLPESVLSEFLLSSC